MLRKPGQSGFFISICNRNATKMRHIKVPEPPLPEQQRFVAAIEQLEQTITAAQAVIAAAPSKKQAIMQAYLS